MPSLADLHRAVGAALAAGRVGTPVFVRYLLLVPEKQEAMAARLAELASVVSDWIGQPPARIYAPASPQGNSATVTLQYRTGATAVVSVGPGDGGADVMVLGNRGALYHELAGGATYEVPPAKVDPQRAALIARALATARPEAVP
ncbi:MAG TPA: hypothetical protein VJ739_15780 [Gemmataceae bacterium]|nr:hypothetical protein [Gemmataceae bacterium]